MAPTPRQLIEDKRDGKRHPAEHIAQLIGDFTAGKLADYQMSAWLMAVYLNGLDQSEMVALTRAMLHSGKTIRHDLDGPVVDKHSTGGVGDKLSLPLGPLVAACGVYVPMISGRGLGHTGGTLDKLESIPGYDVRLDVKRFKQVVKRAGVSIIGQTPDLAPADRRIYSLRDVTGTVECRPLIVASILSKKLAAGLDALVLDVKAGRGAFMQTLPEAQALARSLVSVAGGLGTPTVARLTRMDEPLGTTIGNALEVKESIEILRGEGPKDTTELTLVLGEEMLLVGGVVKTRKEARKKLIDALQSGAGLERFQKMIELHGGDPRVVEEPNRLPRAPRQLDIRAEQAGVVTRIDSRELAEVALLFGAGRLRAEDMVDPAVGIEVHTPVGTQVSRGDALCTLHVRRAPGALAERAAAAFTVRRNGEAAGAPLLLGRIASK